MLKKSDKNELWFYKKEGKSVGILARVPELLRLNIISADPNFTIEDLNKWLYISAIGEITVYSTFEKAQADLV